MNTRFGVSARFISYADLWRLSAVLAFCGLLCSVALPTLLAQAYEGVMGTPDYRNQLFVPGPNPAQFPGVSVRQAESTAFFSGNGGAFRTDDVTQLDDARTPHANGVYLLRSAFGQALATTPRTDFDFGEQILPDPALGADTTQPPQWDPVYKAVWVAEEKKLYASDPGFVWVTWRKADGTEMGPVRYLIGLQPHRNTGAAPVVALYHTHTTAEQVAKLVPPSNTLVPKVVVDQTRFNIKFHYNSAIPEKEGDTRTFILHNPTDGSLYAAERTGLILVEYRNLKGDFLGIETVDVRRADAVSHERVEVAIGQRLAPVEPVDRSMMVTPVVTKGVTAPGSSLNFVYQHTPSGLSEQYGEIYAIRASRLVEPGNVAIEVFWKRKGLNNIEWPYERSRYITEWPENDTSKYQRYARAAAEPHEPDVDIPSLLKAKVMDFQEAPNKTPSTHASISTDAFRTTAAGWCLLMYQTPNNGVDFQVVRSVLHDDASQFLLDPTPHDIGSEIVEKGYHRGPRSGYIYEPAGKRYDAYIYRYDQEIPDTAPGFQTEQIIPVNTGTLEVWWSNLDRHEIQWPSLVKRYDCQWPARPEKVVIAAYDRGWIEKDYPKRIIDPVKQENADLYVQNDVTKAGFNPNDEHARIDQGIVYALRDDLGSSETSQPYALLKYRDPADRDDLDRARWHYIVYKVLMEEAIDLPNDKYILRYPGTAGTLIQPPLPIAAMPKCAPNTGVSGPYWRDRKGDYHAKAAGDDGGAAQVVMHWYYPAGGNFYFPKRLYATAPQPGDCIPWLDFHANTPGVPIDVTYEILWPGNRPVLDVGETLVKPKKGLPAIHGQCSVQILYQQADAVKKGNTSVTLIDPLKERTVHWDKTDLPADVARENIGGVVIFNKLPPHLRERLTYDPVNQLLKFRGVLKEPPAGYPWLLPNIITARERAILADPAVMGSDAELQRKLMELAQVCSNAITVLPTDTRFDGLALTAGFASGTGYVTLAFGNNKDICPPGDPVELEIIRVECPLHTGAIRTVMSDSPFDEMMTLRFDGDLAGRSDQYVFTWAYHRDVDGRPPASDSIGWNVLPPVLGANDLTIGGPSIWTLSDNWFKCQYRPAETGNKTCGAAEWSHWTQPQIAEGWIKRVLARINFYDQCFSDLGNPARTLDTTINMISRAGKRWEGNVPLNAGACEYGLIEIYESILRRAIEYSIEGTPPIDDAPVNNSLMLAAGKLADLYMLLGNEAYADAADPTIPVETANHNYQGAPPTIHAFMNLKDVPDLLHEELALLRGRDDRNAPGVQISPWFNRLPWNFSGDDGQVAYVLNYRPAERASDHDGSITEDDAKALYPQAHGDAWGHYLTAVMNYYRLLSNPHYTWIPRSEAIQIGGQPVTVDYMHERKFARAAAAKARTGLEIVKLTYRQRYSEAPEQQWLGYPDDYVSPKSSDPAATPAAKQPEARAWGVSDWAARAGQGALLDWVMGHAVLPPKYERGWRITDDTYTGLDAAARYLITGTALEKITARFGRLSTGPAFSPDDIKDLSLLVQRLSTELVGVSPFLWAQFSGATKVLVEEYLRSGQQTDTLTAAVVAELNRILDGASVYNSERFAKVPLRSRTSNLLAQNPSGQGLVLLNRLLLDDAYSHELVGTAAVETDKNIAAILQGLTGRVYSRRTDFLADLGAQLGEDQFESLRATLLELTQTQGVPERVFAVVSALVGTHYPNRASVAEVLRQALGSKFEGDPDLYAQHGENVLALVVPPDPAQPRPVELADRGEIVELREVASTLRDIQAEVDKADTGLNPLGLLADAVPFDISTLELDKGNSHFEQIFDRAVKVLNNAVAVFNRAMDSTLALRQQADKHEEWVRQQQERDQDFKSRMIEMFGYPYPEDIGGGGAYPLGYDGPDIYHYSYTDPSELLGTSSGPGTTYEFQVEFSGPYADPGTFGSPVVQASKTITFNVSKFGFGEVKPSAWTGRRRAPGKIQQDRIALIQRKAAFEREVLAYQNHIARIEDQGVLLQAQYQLNLNLVTIMEQSLGQQRSLNQAIARAKERQLLYHTVARVVNLVANAIAEGFPKSVIMGTSSGGDFTSPARQAVLLGAALRTEIATQLADRESLAELDHQQAKEIVEGGKQIAIQEIQGDYAMQQQLKALNELIRDEADRRLAVYASLEAVHEAEGNYLGSLAAAERLWDEFLRFRRDTAGEVADQRYKDLAYRIFRNDALQKYRAQFDLAGRQVYLAKQAFDYETCLRPGDNRVAVDGLLAAICRTRAIGMINGAGQPEKAGASGDPGLADPLARLSGAWLQLEGRLFNNPQPEANRFSLRRELFRFTADEGDNARWREKLQSLRVADLRNEPVFMRYAVLPDGFTATNQPALVIPFKTEINEGRNFFGYPIAGGDSSYDSTMFATRIRSAGIWFVGYNAVGLQVTPRVYLMPVGEDCMRSPTTPTNPNDPRALIRWKVVDQLLPLAQVLEMNNLEKPPWIPSYYNNVEAGFGLELRKYPRLRAYHDGGTFREDETQKSSSLLVGRSVWNTEWLLVIPASTLGSPKTALDTFINGPGPGRTGILDILVYFQTYANPRN